MRGIETVLLRNCYGEEKVTQKVAIFAEADKDGHLFYKAEGSNLNGNAMLFTTYDRKEAEKKCMGYIRELLNNQEKLHKSNKGAL